MSPTSTRRFAGLHALADVDLEIRGGQDPRHHRSERRRQVDAAQRLRRRAAARPRARCIFDGVELTGLQPHEINQLGVVRVFQTPEIFADLTVLDNVMMAVLSRRDGAFRLKLLSRIDEQGEIGQRASGR